MRAIPLLLGLSVSLAGACGGAADRSEAARRALARGDLDRAEVLLASADGAAVAELEAPLARARERRAAELERVERMLAGIPDDARIDVQRRLQELRDATADPAVREAVERELSRLADLYAEARRAPRAPEPTAPEELAEPEAPVASSVPRTTDALVRQRTVYEDGSSPAAPAGPGPAATARSPAAGVAGARPEKAGAPDTPGAARASAAVGPEAAAGEEASAGRELAFPSAAVWESAAGSHARQLAKNARGHVRAGDLGAARDAFQEAAAVASTSGARDGYAGFAQDVADRQQLRAELASAFAAAPGPFRDAGFGAIAAPAVAFEGREIAWSDLALAPLERACGLVSLSSGAALGLVQECLARRDVPAAWSELSALRAAGRVNSATAAGVIARFRGERVPDGGYAYREGDWVKRAELDAGERARRLEELGARFARTRIGRIGELDEIAAGYRTEAGGEELARAASARYAAIAKEIAGDGTVRRLEKLAAVRSELDAARAAALELIFDTEAYFFPYEPPACPADKAARYPAVQRRVDELVRAVEDVWRSRKSVSLDGGFGALRDEVAWMRTAAADAGVELDHGLLPRWFDGVPADLDAVTLQDFAWDAAERDALARDLAVVARNRRLWEEADWPAELDGCAPNAEERRQVEITNEYRRLLGRRALAWSPVLQAAARDHSTSMAATGEFGHFERDPETATPGDRMRRRGYSAPQAENCAMTGGPESAHAGWLHSSGHHRNILMADHQELGSAVAGLYWTQNYGGDRTFESDL